ncbi:MAG: hypothetical protein PHC85_03030, partial [Candidatus Pacebacteria bacterium]|nr:hypothetical protein [Candidatus Paceibacterota bacterium]
AAVAGFVIRAYEKLSHYHALRACDYLSFSDFGKRFEYGKINAQRASFSKLYKAGNLLFSVAELPTRKASGFS